MTRKPDGLLKGGLITNIVLSGLSVLSTAFTISTFETFKTIDMEVYDLLQSLYGLIVVFGVLVPLITIVISAYAFKNEKFKIAAGVLGVISNLIGGILVLVGKYTEDSTDNNYGNIKR